MIVVKIYKMSGLYAIDPHYETQFDKSSLLFHKIRLIGSVKFSKGIIYDVLTYCCEINHFVYVLSILTNPNIAYHFEGTNIICSRIDYMKEVTTNSDIKGMLDNVLIRKDNVVEDLNEFPPDHKCRGYYGDVTEIYDKLHFLIYFDHSDRESYPFLERCCYDNIIAYAIAFLKSDNSTYNFISLTENENIQKLFMKCISIAKTHSDHIIYDFLKCICDHQQE